jgi:hypothetical protein
MLITLYTPIGIVHQKFEITENDIIYNDLIKYIHLPKHELYDELDNTKGIRNKVFIKTIINLFTYENNKEIKLNDEIICDSNEFTIVFSYEYYICYSFYYEKIENNIKNCKNIFDEINNNPYQIIFIENNDEKYYEISKLAVKKNGYILQCIKPEFMTEEICKLAIQENGFALECVKQEFMTEEICKLAIQENGFALECVKQEFMTKEICKLAVQQNGCSLQFVKPELMTDEICKLAVQQDGYSLYYVKPELMTDAICKFAVQKNGYALQFVKPELMNEEICKLAVKQNGYVLQYVKEEFRTPELLKLAR